MLKRIIIQGRMTKDPELRHTQAGTAVASFTLAVDRDFKNQDGEKEADFINCVAWKGTAEMLARYFAKGRMAIVEGCLQSRKYQDKEGNSRTAYEVVASCVYFADSKRDEDSAGRYSGDRYSNPAQAPGYGASSSENSVDSGAYQDAEDDEELPF